MNIATDFRLDADILADAQKAPNRRYRSLACHQRCDQFLDLRGMSPIVRIVAGEELTLSLTQRPVPRPIGAAILRLAEHAHSGVPLCKLRRNLHGRVAAAVIDQQNLNILMSLSQKALEYRPQRRRRIESRHGYAYQGTGPEVLVRGGGYVCYRYALVIPFQVYLRQPEHRQSPVELCHLPNKISTPQSQIRPEQK